MYKDTWFYWMNEKLDMKYLLFLFFLDCKEENVSF